MCGGSMRTGVAGVRWWGVSTGVSTGWGGRGGVLDAEGHGSHRQLHEPQKWALQIPFLAFVLAFETRKKVSSRREEHKKHSTYNTCENMRHTDLSQGLEPPQLHSTVPLQGAAASQTSAACRAPPQLLPQRPPALLSAERFNCLCFTWASS